MYLCILDNMVGGYMNCKEFEMLIPFFIERKLDFRLLKRFGEHMEGCPDCKEELEIQFLVRAGMKRLEEGDVFDLQNELEQRLEEAGRKVKTHYRFLKIGKVLEVLFVMLVAAGMVWMLM